MKQTSTRVISMKEGYVNQVMEIEEMYGRELRPKIGMSKNTLMPCVNQVAALSTTIASRQLQLY